MTAKENEAAQRIARLKATLTRLGVPLPATAAAQKKGQEEGEEMEVEVAPEMAALPYDVRQRCVACVLSNSLSLCPCGWLLHVCVYVVCHCILGSSHQPSSLGPMHKPNLPTTLLL